MRWVALLCSTLLLLGCTSWRAAQLYQSGTAALDAGRNEVALDELQTAAQLQPGSSEIHNHLGLAHWALGDVEAARAAFALAVQLDCDNAAASLNLEAIDAGSGGPR